MAALRTEWSVCTVLVAGLLMVGSPGCTPSSIVGPLSHAEDERMHLITRAQAAGESGEFTDKLIPPLTPQEEALAGEQDSSCRASYMWKNGLTWTGSLLIAVAAGLTVGAAYASGNQNDTNKIAFGISAGSVTALGGGLVAVGGIISSGFTDRGCVSKMSPGRPPTAETALH